MSDKTEQFSVGLCHQFEITARKTGWTPEDLNILAQDTTLCKAALSLVRNQTQIIPIQGRNPIKGDNHLSFPHEADNISFGENPYYTVRTTENLLLDWDPQKVETVSFGGNTPDIKIDTILSQLSGRVVLGMSVLMFLLENPHYYPEAWKGNRQRTPTVYFLGTAFRTRYDQHDLYCGLEWSHNNIKVLRTFKNTKHSFYNEHSLFAVLKK